MEVDSSSTSSDSSSMLYNSNLSGNFYAENLFVGQTQKRGHDFDGFFSKDFYKNGTKAEERVANPLKKVDFFQGKKDDFVITITNGNVNKNRCEEFGKKTFAFNDNFGVKKVPEHFVEDVKNQVECLHKLGDGGSIHLSNVDGFGKKSVGFTADQVKNKTLPNNCL